ncbi:MAG: cell division protein FtsA [Caldiserica bacterium]|nr:MAG: cell division protein FtsA [Caldisericota bacterium]
MSEIITGIDIGSNNVVCVVGRIEGRNINVIGYSKVPCDGLRFGVVVNIEKTVKAVRKAIDEVEDKSGEVIRTAYVGIKGSHIHCFKNEGATAISGTDKEITVEDIRQVIESAKAIRVPSGSEIIHVIPQEFIVDGQGGVDSPPVGMEARHLGVKVFIATASVTAISNIVRCINKAGVEVNEVILSSIANSEVAVSKEEKQLGVVLVDFGAQTIDVVMFTDGNIRDIKEIQVGGDFITRDIAHFFRVSIKEAERIKENFGVSSSSLIKEDEEIQALGIDRRRKIVISKRELSKVIEERLKEIFSKVRRVIESSGVKDLIPGGIVFTGGSSLITGITEMAEDFFWGLPARLGYPLDIGGPDEIISSPIYTTGCGLIKYAISNEVPSLGGKVSIRSVRKPPFSKLFSWIKKLF